MTHIPLFSYYTFQKWEFEQILENSIKMNENCKKQNPTKQQHRKRKQQRYVFGCPFIVPVMRLICTARTIVSNMLLLVYHFCLTAHTRSLYLTIQRHISNTFPCFVHKNKHKQCSTLSRTPVLVRVEQIIFGIIISLQLYVISVTVYWSFHHLQCYSREVNVVWDEGVAHSIHRNHTCPKPLYYNDDNLRSTSNNTSDSFKNSITDPRRICITSLSDGSQTNNNNNNSRKKVRDSFLSLLTSFLNRMLSVRCRDFSSVEEYTWPLTLQYCKKHGYTCYEGSDLLDTSRPAAWSKIRAVYYLLTNSTLVVQPTSLLLNNKQSNSTTDSTVGSCDWVLWMDADTIIMNSNVRIEDLLPTSPLPSHSTKAAITDAATVTDNEDVINLIVTYDRRFTANSGIWIIRNTYWSHQFLYNWWTMTNFVRAKGFSLSGDNQAFGNLLDTTYDVLRLKQQVQQQSQQQITIENVDVTNKIISGPIRMIPRCQMNSFGVFIPNNNKKSYKKGRFSNHTVRSYVDSNSLIGSTSSDINHLFHVNSDEYYHYGDFIAHASGIDQKEAGVKLLLQHAII